MRACVCRNMKYVYMKELMALAQQQRWHDSHRTQQNHRHVDEDGREEESRCRTTDRRLSNEQTIAMHAEHLHVQTQQHRERTAISHRHYALYCRILQMIDGSPRSSESQLLRSVMCVAFCSLSSATATALEFLQTEWANIENVDDIENSCLMFNFV